MTTPPQPSLPLDSTGVPTSAVYAPNTGVVSAQGGAVTQDIYGNPSAPVNVTLVGPSSSALTLVAPPTTTNVGSDTPLVFTAKANHFLVQNNTSASAYVALDTPASPASTVLMPGSQWRDDLPVTVIHVYTPAAQNVNGATGIVVLGWT